MKSCNRQVGYKKISKLLLKYEIAGYCGEYKNLLPL